MQLSLRTWIYLNCKIIPEPYLLDNTRSLLLCPQLARPNVFVICLCLNTYYRTNTIIPREVGNTPPTTRRQKTYAKSSTKIVPKKGHILLHDVYKKRDTNCDVICVIEP